MFGEENRILREYPEFFLNKAMFKMFNLIGYGEHAGSGVPDIYKVWKDANLSSPIVEEQLGRDEKPDRTMLTLPLVAYSIGANLGGDTPQATPKLPHKPSIKQA